MTRQYVDLTPMQLLAAAISATRRAEAAVRLEQATADARQVFGAIFAEHETEVPEGAAVGIDAGRIYFEEHEHGRPDLG